MPFSFRLQFVAIGARDLPRARKFADKHGFKKAYGSYDEIANDQEIGESLQQSNLFTIVFVKL